MAITSNFNDGEFRRELEEKMKLIHERIIAAMHYAGEKFIREAREQVQDHAQGTYLDQTTNLRNSIQYMILENGEVLESSESEFSASNRIKIQDLINKKGYQLIGIAGMNYASHVESKGYNVISNQKETCIIDLTRYFKEIEKYIDK